MTVLRFPQPPPYPRQSGSAMMVWHLVLAANVVLGDDPFVAAVAYTVIALLHR